MPWPASASAAMHPTGPPPATNMGRSVAGISELQSERLDGARPQGGIGSEHGAELGRRIAEGIGAILVEARDELRIFDGAADFGGGFVDDLLGRCRLRS